MALYKYFSTEGAKRFLSTWSLRLTPPDQFNDPFEMCPPIQIVTEEEIFSPEVMREEVAARIARDLMQGGVQEGAASPLAKMFASSLLGRLNAKEERRFLKMLPVVVRSKVKSELPAVRQQLELGIAKMREQFPAMSTHLERTMHRSVRENIGVLCMCSNSSHPLMWAHYAEEHRGVMIEFDETSSCFSRRRSDSDELGAFKSVNYSATRPELNGNSGDDWFRQLALTKAIEWSYESEMRFLLSLDDADRVVGQGIHLLQIPVSAVRSITLGCRAPPETADMVCRLLGDSRDASHILKRKSHVDQRTFSLNYLPLES